jgi:cobyrinic acid a,c-diamide synthase
VEILGYLPKDAGLTIPERHLGLLPASEEDRVTPLLEHLTTLVNRYIDLDRLMHLAQTAPALTYVPSTSPGTTKHMVRIAWAQDEAFHFSYQENIDLLSAAGAEIIPFSPLHDRAVPEGIDALWLGGGFPENFAAQLAANTAMLATMRECGARGLPIYAECGGFMYLCEWLEDHQGQRYPQVGLIPGGTRMTDRLQQFGYAEATFLQDTLLGPAGTAVRGHRFHYSVYEPGSTPLTCAYRITRATTGEAHLEGFYTHNVLATYLHIHLGSQPHMARHLVNFCQRQRI